MADEQPKLPAGSSWPNGKGQLFRSKPPKRGKPDASAPFRPTSGSESVFKWDHDETWDDRYRDGWFWGAENLARDLIQRSALEKVDSEREFRGVYLPMLYCYRHYLEVTLKHLIKKLTRLSDREVTIDLQKEHGLMPLWNEARRQMKVTIDNPDCDPDDSDKNVERQINEFHQFDPSSQTFRYRRDTNGRPQEGSIPDGDLEQLIRAMRGLRNYFDGCEGCADHVAETRAELRSEIPDDY